MNPHPAHVVQRLYGTPLALHPLHAPMVRAAASASLSGAMPAPGGQAYEVVQGVAIIPIRGLLVHRLGLPAPFCGMTGYDSIRLALAQALADRGIRGIVLDIDSPGGEMGGLFALADSIFAARDQKPIWAVLDEDGFAAAYAIASACTRICVPRTGSTGSIGVLALFLDTSGALERAGIKVHVFQFGDRKADGFPEVPLAPAARTRFQADVDTLGGMLVNAIARNRKLTPAAIIAQQAATYMGQDGVKAGLADMVASPDQALQALLAELATGRKKQLSTTTR